MEGGRGGKLTFSEELYMLGLNLMRAPLPDSSARRISSTRSGVSLMIAAKAGGPLDSRLNDSSARRLRRRRRRRARRRSAPRPRGRGHAADRGPAHGRGRGGWRALRGSAPPPRAAATAAELVHRPRGKRRRRRGGGGSFGARRRRVAKTPKRRAQKSYKFSFSIFPVFSLDFGVFFIFYLCFVVWVGSPFPFISSSTIVPTSITNCKLWQDQKGNHSQ